MGTNTLMSVVDAAGFAMAAPDDDATVVSPLQPEVALRNGHKEAAHTSPETLPAPFMAEAGWLAALREHLRDYLGGWWGGRAHA